MSWYIQVPVVSMKRAVRSLPITNKEQETIIKYSMSANPSPLLDYLDDMMQKLLAPGQIDYNQLTMIDKLMILLRLRAASVSPVVKLTIKDDNDDKGNNITVQLVQLLESLEKNYIDPVEIVDPTTEARVIIHYPKNLTYESDRDFIQSLVVDNLNIPMSQLTDDQFNAILENFSPRFNRQLQRAKNSIIETINRIVFIPSIANPTGESISLDVEELPRFIKLVFSETLGNHIELMYVFVKVIGMSLSDIKSLTPLDTQLYYKMFLKEQSEKEKAIATQKQKQRSVR